MDRSHPMRPGSPAFARALSSPARPVSIALGPSAAPASRMAVYLPEAAPWAVARFRSLQRESLLSRDLAPAAAGRGTNGAGPAVKVVVLEDLNGRWIGGTILSLAGLGAPVPLAHVLARSGVAAPLGLESALRATDVGEIGDLWVDASVEKSGVDYHAVAGSMALLRALRRTKCLAVVAPHSRAIADALGWMTIAAPFPYSDDRYLSVVMSVDVDRFAAAEGHWSRFVADAAERLRSFVSSLAAPAFVPAGPPPNGAATDA